MRNKAQIWGLDLIIAITIFIIGLTIFYLYVLNHTKGSEENLDSLLYEGNFIASSLLTSGYPKNWTPDNVVTIGIADDGKINDTKLADFYNLSITDYNKTRAIFNTKYNYYMNFSESMIFNGNYIEVIGLKPDNPRSLIKIERLTNYKNKLVTLKLLIWE